MDHRERESETKQFRDKIRRRREGGAAAILLEGRTIDNPVERGSDGMAGRGRSLSTWCARQTRGDSSELDRISTGSRSGSQMRITTVSQ